MVDPVIKNDKYLWDQKKYQFTSGTISNNTKRYQQPSSKLFLFVCFFYLQFSETIKTTIFHLQKNARKLNEKSKKQK